MNFALLPAGMMVAGALLAAWRTPGPKLRSTLLHFAAGVVFAVVAVDLLPDIMKRHAPIEVGVGSSLGVAVMFGLRYFGEWMEKKPLVTNLLAPCPPQCCPGACWVR
ncbi:hypothetical protein D0N36_10780 [Hymenobacter lapidiphilus]|uniref:hypothetical protein n=1 Tax=Hymenobacter sp. CCM 8763 TaxID=2303334 RepID=UPI000E35790A|nr:hypothetical protein [Hymenobacter sp. CCM 8763]RFP65156.1 hypothetical protein D0N36_10780 [Hymenobacter sp. CCM 8763]